MMVVFRFVVAACLVVLTVLAVLDSPTLYRLRLGWQEKKAAQDYRNLCTALQNTIRIDEYPLYGATFESCQKALNTP